jgi:serine protease Do
MNRTKNLFVITIIVSLVIGSVSGMLGSFFLKPYMESTTWGRAFLQTNISERLEDDDASRVLNVVEESATIEVVNKVSDSVVSIVVTKELENIYNLTGPDAMDYFDLGINPNYLPGGSQKREVGGGTGFVIGEDGLILTNRHVVEDEKADYSVVFNDGEKYEAVVLGRDMVRDIAVLKIEASDLSVVELADSEEIEIGQTVIAIGNALSEYRNTVTRGVISGIDRRVVAGSSRIGSSVIDGAIQTDAAINPGNSGGPLLNLAGQVVGINTAVNFGGNSIGFAIPINQAKSVIESVNEFGRIVRPWLGIRYIELSAEIAEKNNIEYDYGVLVLRGENSDDLAVIPESPADKAGIVENDIVLEFNGQKLDSEHSLINEITKYKPGEVVELKVFHDGEELEVSLELAEREE